MGAFTAAGLVDVAGSHFNNSGGVIQAAWGGTPINIWMDPTAIAKCPTTYAQLSPDMEQGPTQPGSIDSAAYNTMIAPLTVGPLAVKGFLWYQGENNVGQGKTLFFGCSLW